MRRFKAGDYRDQASALINTITFFRDKKGADFIAQWFSEARPYLTPQEEERVLTVAMGSRNIDIPLSIAKDMGLNLHKKEDFMEILPLLKHASHSFFAKNIIRYGLWDKIVFSQRFGEVHGLLALSRAVNEHFFDMGDLKEIQISLKEDKDLFSWLRPKEDLSKFFQKNLEAISSLLHQKDPSGDLLLRKERSTFEKTGLLNRIATDWLPFSKSLRAEDEFDSSFARVGDALRTTCGEDQDRMIDLVSAIWFDSEEEVSSKALTFFWGRGIYGKNNWTVRLDILAQEGALTTRQSAMILRSLFDLSSLEVSIHETHWVFQKEIINLIMGLWEAIKSSDQFDSAWFKDFSPDIQRLETRGCDKLVEALKVLFMEIEKKTIIFEAEGAPAQPTCRRPKNAI